MEAASQTSIRLTIAGAGEAHILARELHEANVGIILTPARPFPHTWDQRRMYVRDSILHSPHLKDSNDGYSLPGPPLSNNSAVMELVANDVVVGLGCENMWSASARNLPFDIGWVRKLTS